MASIYKTQQLIMDKLLVRGGQALNGEIRVSGAKNAALPALIASLLADSPVQIGNIPHLQDITTTLKLLQHLGASIKVDEKLSIEVDASELTVLRAPYEKKIFFSLIVQNL